MVAAAGGDEADAIGLIVESVADAVAARGRRVQSVASIAPNSGASGRSQAFARTADADGWQDRALGPQRTGIREARKDDTRSTGEMRHSCCTATSAVPLFASVRRSLDSLTSFLHTEVLHRCGSHFSLRSRTRSSVPRTLGLGDDWSINRIEVCGADTDDVVQVLSVRGLTTELGA